MDGISISFPVVINTDWGGYGLSRAAELEVLRRKGLDYRQEGGALLIGASGWDTVSSSVPRNDPDLVAVVREMGAAADGPTAKLAVREVSVAVEILDHDGRERIRVHGGADW